MQPVLDSESQSFKSREHQRQFLDEMAFLNGEPTKQHPEHRDLAARINTYELAYRMQMEVPDLIDLKGETDATRDTRDVWDE